MTVFSAIAWYNAAEILTLILFVFKKYSGLYFWSLLLTTIAVIPYQFGAWTKQNIFLPHLEMLSVTLSSLGWLVMVPGQSLVLYSRLHLVTQNERLLKFILRMIIFNAIVLCIPCIVLTYGSNTAAKDHYLGAYAVYEKMQMTMFTLQEFFISGVYIFEVRNILKMVMEGGTRNLMWQLAAINVFIIVMDIALLAVEFANFYQIETTLKGMIYSIKLKLEFGVLSKLVKVVTDRNDPNRVGTARNNNTSNKRYEMDSIDLESLPSQKGSIVPAQKSSSILLRTGSQTRQVEYIVKDDNIMYPDWRMTSEPRASQLKPHLMDEITEFKHKRSISRRSSISDLYPGRLGPPDKAG